uniref:Uncharacterized protein n=1 Tax=Anguilla anguilla TaxID=7936 RepID=A0A0E9RNK0_ANGAN
MHASVVTCHDTPETTERYKNRVHCLALRH